MQTLASRAGRWPLALTLVALTALVACTDEPVAPNKPPTLKPNASIDEPVTVLVTNTSGGTEVGSLRWAAEQIKDAALGVIEIDRSLGGKTITLDAGLDLPADTYIWGSWNGITISGNGQFRLITSRRRVQLEHVTLTNGYGDNGSAVQGVYVSLLYSTVTGNRGGPAIFAEKGFAMYNSTVSGNAVAKPAIFWMNGAAVAIEQSTVAYNGPAPGIGMLDAPYPDPATFVTLRNSIISNNGTQNCYNMIGFVYEGANLSNDWSCGEVGITIADPKLFPLANNGGPTRTHAIPPTSPARNNAIACQWNDDQRHVRREAKCDIGAFEFNDPTKVAITIDPTVKMDAAGEALLTGTITCSREDTFRLALELHQEQKVGKNVVDVHSANDIPVTCSTIAKPWSAPMAVGAEEAFQTGAGRAFASTFQTPDWVTPVIESAAVKISAPRK
jgi:hypothetical protein